MDCRVAGIVTCWTTHIHTQIEGVGGRHVSAAKRRPALPRQVKNHNAISPHHLRVKLILTRENALVIRWTTSRRRTTSRVEESERESRSRGWSNFWHFAVVSLIWGLRECIYLVRLIPLHPQVPLAPIYPHPSDLTNSEITPRFVHGRGFLLVVSFGYQANIPRVVSPDA